MHDMQSNAELVRRAGQISPGLPAVRCGDERLSYGELYARSCRLVHALLDAGIAPGDRVAVLGPNSIRSVEQFAGLALGGFVRVSLQYGNPIERHLDMLRRSGARALIVDAGSLGRLGEEIARLSPAPIVIVDDAADYEDRLARVPDRDDQWPVGSDDVSQIVFTGGTTGMSLGTTQTHRAFLDHTVENLALLPALDEDDAYLVATSLSGAPGAYLYPAIARLLEIVILPEFDASQVVDLIAHDHVTFTVLLPGMLQAVLDDAATRGIGIRRLRAVFVVGTPMAERTIRETRDRLGDVLFFGYGATECAPIAMLTPNDVRRALAGRPEVLRSVGRPTPRGHIRFVDGDGRRVPVGVLGDAEARGAGLMRGYWEDEERTREKLTADGWVRMGDVGRVDEHGYITIVGRSADMITIDGRAVHPSDVENAISELPEIQEVAVFAIGARPGSASMCAVVRVRGGADPAAIADWIESGPATEFPIERIAFSSEPLPKSAAGKILRHEARELVTQWDRVLAR